MHKKISEKADKVIKLILFLISPFIAFLYSLRNMKAKSSYVVFFLFCVFFGMAFTVPSGKSEEFGLDGAVYRQIFEQSSIYNSDEYVLLLSDYAQFDEGSKDFYVISLSFLLSRLTDNYHVLFLVYAIVFAFFMLKSFRFLTEEKEFDASLLSFLLAAMFILSNSIFNINGVRFWTASWIFVYGVFQVFRNNNKRYFLLICLSPMVHVSFYFVAALSLIAYFTKKYDRFWITLFVVSFFISNFSVVVLEYISQYLPTILSRIVQSYIRESYILKREEQIGFLKSVFDFLQWLYVNIIIFLFYKNRQIIKHLPKAYNLYLFLIIFMTLVNFTMPIPSVGGRFIMLSLPIVAYIWLLVFKGRKYNVVLYLYPVVFLFSLYRLVGLYMRVTNLEFYLMNPFYLINKYLL